MIASVLKQILMLKRGQKGGGIGRDNAQRLEAKNYPFQCKFAVLAFLPLALDACASQYNQSDATSYYVSPF